MGESELAQPSIKPQFIPSSDDDNQDHPTWLHHPSFTPLSKNTRTERQRKKALDPSQGSVEFPPPCPSRSFKREHQHPLEEEERYDKPSLGLLPLLTPIPSYRARQRFKQPLSEPSAPLR